MVFVLAGSPEPRRDRKREGVQRDGHTEAVVRSTSPRVAEQAVARTDCAPRALLRPTEAEKRRGRTEQRARRGDDEESATVGRVVGERKRSFEIGVDEDEALHIWHAAEEYARL